MSRLAHALAAAALGAAIAACEPGPERPDKNPPPRPPAAETGSAAAPAPTPPASAAPPALSSSARAPAADAASFAGAWEGRYEAKKGSVTLPPKVKDKALAADEGKALVGPGTIELTISKDGELQGKGKGALGAIVLTGKVDEGMVRATVMAEDPRAANAPSGVLVGPLKDGAIKARLRVSVIGADLVVVREAEFELKKKP